MPDREKVIKGLECCEKQEKKTYDTPCRECPYFNNTTNPNCGEMLHDALKLLKYSRLIHTEHALYTVYEKHNGEQNV